MTYQINGAPINNSFENKSRVLRFFNSIERWLIATVASANIFSRSFIELLFGIWRLSGYPTLAYEREHRRNGTGLAKSHPIDSPRLLLGISALLRRTGKAHPANTPQHPVALQWSKGHDHVAANTAMFHDWQSCRRIQDSSKVADPAARRGFGIQFSVPSASPIATHERKMLARLLGSGTCRDRIKAKQLVLTKALRCDGKLLKAAGPWQFPLRHRIFPSHPQHIPPARKPVP